MSLNYCVLVSGGGSNLQALIDAHRRGEINANICGVIASKPDAYALVRARENGIPSQVVSRRDYADAQAHQAGLLEALVSTGADFVVLAGYLSILGAGIIRRYPGRIINVHPALLPAFGGKGYYGLKVHQAALDYGVKVSGATVHLVDEGTDTGPIIFQDGLAVDPDETAESLQQRVMEIEHRLLPKAVALMALGQIKADGRKVIICKGEDK